MYDSSFEPLIKMHLATLPLSHTAPPTPSRPAAWLRGVGAVGARAPLFLIQDLGVILTCPHDRLHMARPAHKPDDIDTTTYLNFLARVARYPLLCDISAWDMSDPVVGVVIARLLADVDFPKVYAFLGGPEAVELARQLGAALDRADSAQIWRETVPSRRPDLAALLPAESMTRIEKNLRNLNADELRFMHRYGPRISGAPEPSELLDLFSLMGLPPAVRLAMNQLMSYNNGYRANRLRKFRYAVVSMSSGRWTGRAM